MRASPSRRPRPSQCPESCKSPCLRTRTRPRAPGPGPGARASSRRGLRGQSGGGAAIVAVPRQSACAFPMLLCKGGSGTRTSGGVARGLHSRLQTPAWLPAVPRTCWGRQHRRACSAYAAASALGKPVRATRRDLPEVADAFVLSFFLDGKEDVLDGSSRRRLVSAALKDLEGRYGAGCVVPCPASRVPVNSPPLWSRCSPPCAIAGDVRASSARCWSSETRKAAWWLARAWSRCLFSTT